MKKQNSATYSKPIENRKETKVRIKKLPTVVRGLDEILGGGIPEYSFNVIAGTPGCGKTTLAHQIVFANSTPKKPALYFTVLGEPAMKMLRYQQQYSFFDESKVGNAIRFVNLADTLQEGNLNAVLEEIIKQVTAASPSVVVVDSFRTLGHKAAGGANADEMQLFVQRLAQFLTTWEATTFLVGEYSDEEIRDNPLFTIADGLIWVWQVTERNSVVRKLQIIKLRGQASVPGLHTIRISEDGLQAFSRTLGLVGVKSKTARRRFLSIGIPELDKMMGGGILEGDSLLVARPCLIDEHLPYGTRARDEHELAWAEQRLTDLGFIVSNDGNVKRYTNDRPDCVVFADPRAFGQIDFAMYKKPVAKNAHLGSSRCPRGCFSVKDNWKRDLMEKYEARLASR